MRYFLTRKLFLRLQVMRILPLRDCRVKGRSCKSLWAARGILARQYLRVHEALKIERIALHGAQNSLVGHAGLTVTRSDSTPPGLRIYNAWPNDRTAQIWFCPRD